MKTHLCFKMGWITIRRFVQCSHSETQCNQVTRAGPNTRALRENDRIFVILHGFLRLSARSVHY